MIFFLSAGCTFSSFFWMKIIFQPKKKKKSHLAWLLFLSTFIIFLSNSFPSSVHFSIKPYSFPHPHSLLGPYAPYRLPTRQQSKNHHNEVATCMRYATFFGFFFSLSMKNILSFHSLSSSFFPHECLLRHPIPSVWGHGLGTVLQDCWSNGSPQDGVFEWSTKSKDRCPFLGLLFLRVLFLFLNHLHQALIVLRTDWLNGAVGLNM